MTHITRSALIQQPAEHLYNLVLDVESYPDFLPWCSQATVIEQSELRQVASVGIRKGPLNTSFSTINELSPGQSIHMRLRDGPFRTLDGQWRFSALSDDACRVELDIRFDFAGPAALVLKPVFAQICATFLSAFVQRASEVDRFDEN